MMDIGTPIIEHRALDVADLRRGVAALNRDIWGRDEDTRAGLAEDRPGNAIYYYNNAPSFVRRTWSQELAVDGALSVLRNVTYPLFEAVDALIERDIAPLYPACDVVRAQLAELPAKARIARHRDSQLLALTHRLHVPVTTNPGVRFSIGDGDYTLAEGTLYELNNVAEHAVRNEGDTSRVHLLVDMMPHAVGRARYFDRAKDMHIALIKAGLYRP